MMNNTKGNRLQLLQEWTPLEVDQSVIEEAAATKGPLLLRGILQKADTLNQNGRVYPRAILEREVRNYQKFINERRAVGQLDHPQSSVVELEKGSHVVTEAILRDDGTVYGTIEVLDELPMGKILRGYIKHGIKVGISSRGVGSTKEERDHQRVNDDFQLICWDVVCEPSTPGAFMMSEGRVIYDAQGNPIVGYERTNSDRIISCIDSILLAEGLEQP